MKKTIYFLMLACLFLFLLGCSSDGDGDGDDDTLTPEGTEVDVSYLLSIWDGTAPQGTQVSFSLTGTDSEGRRWTGSVTMVSDGATTYENQNVTKSRILPTLTLDDETASNIITHYFLTSDRSIYEFQNNLAGTIAVPISQEIIPDVLQVGDSGDWFVTLNSDGETDINTWRLDADYNGNSKLIITSTTRDAEDNTTYIENQIFYLDADGDPYRFEMISTWTDDNLTLRMAGNRN